MRWWSWAAAAAVLACGAAPASAPEPGPEPAGTTEAIEAPTGSTGLEDQPTGSSSGTTDSELSSSGVQDGPPEVIDVTPDVPFVTVGESITLTAFVQHPRGDAAVVAGELLGPGVPAQYGEFTRGTNGRWHMTVGWNDVAARTMLDFVGELDVEFTARFVDDAGLVGEGVGRLRHHCPAFAAHACNGVCVSSSSSDQHCGACGHPCDAPPAVGLQPVRRPRGGEL